MASSPHTAADQSFPSYLTTVNVSNFVSSKLSGDSRSNNYRSWRRQLLCLIEAHDLTRFIDAMNPPSADNNVAWRTDRVVMGWILGSLDDPTLRTVAHLVTARDVWAKLEKNNGGPTPTSPPQPQGTLCLTINGPPPEMCGPSWRRTTVGQPPPARHSHKHEWQEYLPLYRATLMGDWERAKQIIARDPHATTTRIAFTLETSLHIAVGTGKALHFVQNLVDIMPDDLLGVKDELGYTALHVASLTGNKVAAKILVGRRPDLLCALDNVGNFPVHKAALAAHGETLWYLISETRDDWLPSPYLGEMASRFYVALYLAQKYSHLASLKLKDGTSALSRLALKDYAFPSGVRRFNFWERFIYSVPHAKANRQRKRTHELVFDLLRTLCKNMECLDYNQASGIYVDAILLAARSGVHEVIEELEVKKFLKPYSQKRFNNSESGKTAEMVFTDEHKELKSEGEKWMKDTANSCTIAAALIATVVFAAAITVPGGNASNGFPFFSTKAAFIIFAISDAVSLSSRPQPLS
ncbi:ankyrin repeat family protein [Striga asiatica]|uniref:Ankyrin repeat family protein n=1 Tax=Striga asiatica TaxID=4170 RepID=A0A5A7QG19_STRAF|nr:ankyrin repeat family protein [Striga asiatica]